MNGEAMGILFMVRFIILRFVAKDHLFPELFIAPRGLITVLLFFVLAKYDGVKIESFDTGLLLYPILITSIIMMIALILNRGEKVKDVLFHSIPLINSSTDPKKKAEIKERIEKNAEGQDFDGFRHDF